MRETWDHLEGIIAEAIQEYENQLGFDPSLTRTIANALRERGLVAGPNHVARTREALARSFEPGIHG